MQMSPTLPRHFMLVLSYYLCYSPRAFFFLSFPEQELSMFVWSVLFPSPTASNLRRCIVHHLFNEISAQIKTVPCHVVTPIFSSPFLSFCFLIIHNHFFINCPRPFDTSFSLRHQWQKKETFGGRLLSPLYDTCNPR